MTLKTMVARVACVQTLVTLAALGAVVLATSIGFTLLLARQTDRALNDLLGRTLTYLDGASDAKSIDWQWLSAEIDEIRPRHVRFELAQKTPPIRLIELGRGPALAPAANGCSEQRRYRVCARSDSHYAAVAASDHSVELAVRNPLILALGLACVIAGACVAMASVAVTKRAIRPLSDLAARVAAVEPGSGEKFQPPATLRELELLERRFADLVDRFDDALRRERLFTAHASHELRTPLTVARAELERLENCAPALTALKRLESLIQSLLWLARAQASLQGEDMEVVNLADIVADQLDQLRLQHSSLVVTALIPDEALVRGDEQLLSNAIQNLLDNARKHGGGSSIAVELRRQSQHVVLCVTNGGASIPQALREQVFIPFVRAGDGTTGFGLGLPFARAVARAHGGEVTLKPEGDAGTTVLLRLPLMEWHAAPARFDSVQNGSEA